MTTAKSKVIVTANDLGYSSVKADIDDKELKFPSVMAQLRPQDVPTPAEINSDNEMEVYMNNFLDNMDVTVASNTVKTASRFLIGQAAVNSGLSLRQLDINDYTGKSETDLSVILTLSMIAGRRVQEAYKNGEDITKELQTDAYMATALPVSEGKRDNARDAYAQRYLSNKHVVTFHNFADPITVNITFKKVYVALEGETAQMIIASDMEGLSEGIKKDFDENYPELAEDVTVDDIIGAKNAVGIDIGGGTTDVVAIINGKANASASTSVPNGYGSVLQEAVRILQDRQMNFEDRSQLQSFIEEKVSPLRRGQQKAAQQVVDEQVGPLTDSIIDAASQTLRVARDTEVIFVYGGGSIPMKSNSDLRTRLAAKVKSFTGGYDIPVVWIPQEYAQKLNLYGLEAIARQLTADANKASNSIKASKEE